MVLARSTRRDRLERQDVLSVIVVEKATLVAQLYAWFGDTWGVPIAALRGYASEPYERTIIELVEEEVDTSTREVTMLYCGDFDPSGEDIPRSFQANTGLHLQRVALSWEQVVEHGLPPAMGKATDARAAGFVARHGQLVQVAAHSARSTESNPASSTRSMGGAKRSQGMSPRSTQRSSLSSPSAACNLPPTDFTSHAMSRVNLTAVPSSYSLT
jgi:hypothetical protein